MVNWNRKMGNDSFGWVSAYPIPDTVFFIMLLDTFETNRYTPLYFVVCYFIAMNNVQNKPNNFTTERHGPVTQENLKWHNCWRWRPETILILTPEFNIWNTTAAANALVTFGSNNKNVYDIPACITICVLWCHSRFIHNNDNVFFSPCNPPNRSQ